MKRILCILISVAVLICTVSVTSTMTASAEQEHIFSYHDVEFDVDTPEYTDEVRNFASAGEILPSSAGQIPTHYSSVSQGNVTTAKNQGSYGTCWAFSATSAAESSVYLNDDATYDLSELQLAYYFYHDKIDPLGYASGDSTSALTSTPLKLGGNHLFTMWALAGWTNATTENILSYSSKNCTAAENGTLSEEYANRYDVAHLQNAYILPYSTSSANMNNIKAAIMQYGSVACSYYHDDAKYNSSYCSYYSTNTETNHAVTIVGWNDSFSKNNFNSSGGGGSWISQWFGNKGKPSANGAWLVKNSWGSSWGTDGDDDPAKSRAEGYFWLSYYDSSIASSEKVFVYDYFSTDRYQYNYQYDGSCGISTKSLSSGQKAAAVYTVKGLSSDYESIDAVGIGISSANVSGTVSVYADPKDQKPESGTLVAQQSFHTVYSGFHTVKLDEPPVLKKGQDYSVVVKFDSSAVIFVDKTYQNGDWISFTADTSKDKTYTVSSSSVTDLGKSGLTARIKAYTNDAVSPFQTYAVAFHANQGNGAPETVYKTEGENVTHPSTVPIRAGYDFVGWAYRADADQPDFYAGDVYSEDKDAVLYAVWKLRTVISLGISDATVDLTVGGEEKIVTVLPTPADATYEITVKNAEYDGEVYRIDGLEIKQNGNEFSIKAVSKETNTVAVVFAETKTGAEISCNVNVTKIIFADDLVICRKALLLLDEYDAACDTNADGVIDIRDLIRMKKSVQ